ncbi:hypothetical protein ADK67_13865 [Saccharothrix sp. NRRL B-16348]|uniref:hypothetical protein n=1 Tax=Saccharothrix sp. NRRL B-16348 TaxID=1415542 RepID=UPI0006AF486F|nr:hypothetical protein [Saccharothrix sp. NRRL B-16348]KOX27512.1 hypothetical protein ADK67_13865 [Saccharothrix sp. NRRL B-16348]
MSIYLDSRQHTFPKKMREAQKAEVTFRVPGKVVDAHAALKSFSAVYSDGERTVQVLSVKLGTPHFQPASSGYSTVTVPVEYLLRDFGNDDNYEGEVEVLLIAVVEDKVGHDA